MSLYQAAAAMSAHARWQEAISENLAAANIPGFKKQDLSFEAVQAGVMTPSGADARTAFLLPHAILNTDFSQGALRQTGAKTDVAIEGPGFFSVELPTRGTGYTRDGEFHLNASGQLVTKQGFPVLGEAGPIQVDRNLGGEITIEATGEVSQGGEVRGKLKVVDFAQPQTLTAAGGGIYTNSNPTMGETEAPQTSLRQGFLESANISTVLEMANLVGVMRGFEANQRAMLVHSERLGRTISELGNPN